MPFHSGRRPARRWISLFAIAIASRRRIATGPVSRSRRALSIAQRGVGRLAAGRLSADAVDDHEEAARGVDVEPILVDLALQSRIGVAGRPDGADRFHGLAGH